MGIFDALKGATLGRSGVISGGKQKNDGTHDHRTNTGGDRTPAQKEGDKKRKK